MLKTITGSSYKSMIQYGVNCLDKHCAAVNDLNVFPVPDGDTGTNMVLTLKNGLQAVTEQDPLCTVAAQFANATVFGARGNSGVILSQFFKGIGEAFAELGEADCKAFSRALDVGCERAFTAVAKPVEGTILTVMREAATAVREHLADLHTIDDLVALFLQEAEKSLENTPRLLPILEKAGVVDSGGAGLVYFFEGVKRYLDGEEPESVESTQEPTSVIDYTAFNKDTNFEYGYCTEFLLQLTVEPSAFHFARFKSNLQKLGSSLVASLEGDKIKIHIHTRTPEKVMEFCHAFGEFLSLKIENMSVQHTEATQRILCAEEPASELFATVAVAPNGMLQNMLAQMGADVVILSAESPSSQDFLEAFAHTSAKNILVFPNSSNSILSAMQAGSLHKKAKITVLNCRSIAACYSALSIIDYGAEDIGSVVTAVNDVIGNLYEVAVVHATKNIRYGNKKIVKNDYFALAGEEILATAYKLEDLVLRTVNQVLCERECTVVTMFYGQNVTAGQLDGIIENIRGIDGEIEICRIPTQNAIYDLILSFE